MVIPCIRQILGDITAVLTDPSAPLALPRRRPDAAAGSELEQIVPTLETWSQQLSALPVSLAPRCTTFLRVC